MKYFYKHFGIIVFITIIIFLFISCGESNSNEEDYWSKLNNTKWKKDDLILEFYYNEGKNIAFKYVNFGYENVIYYMSIYDLGADEFQCYAGTINYILTNANNGTILTISCPSNIGGFNYNGEYIKIW